MSCWNPGRTTVAFWSGILSTWFKTPKRASQAAPTAAPGSSTTHTSCPMLGFIATLSHPELVGVNPEVAHAKMAGLNAVHEVAQALDQGKLFHIDLNDQRLARFDQDLRFGSDDVKGSFYLVKLLEDSGYQGSLHFDAHPYRTEDSQGVWEFARGCMRSYLAYKEKVRQFREDADIQAVLAHIQHLNQEGPAIVDEPSLNWWRERGYAYEELDQLITELILGLR